MPFVGCLRYLYNFADKTPDYWLNTVNALFTVEAVVEVGFGGWERFAANAGLKPLGLGSTGRTIAVNLVEQTAMKEVMANPQLGEVIMTGMMLDG